MRKSMGEARDAEARALDLAVQVAELLEQMDRLAPGATAAGNGRITGPGVEIRRIAGRWTAEATG